MKDLKRYLDKIGIKESRTDAKNEPPAVFYSGDNAFLVSFDYYGAGAPASYYIKLKQQEKMILDYCTRHGYQAIKVTCGHNRYISIPKEATT